MRDTKRGLERTEGERGRKKGRTTEKPTKQEKKGGPKCFNRFLVDKYKEKSAT